ncbi:LytTR family DNA-binding domain-containing protein [Pedobacter sp. Du54]|uniref:LytR/AlgR family response regulator transcription factor n=1 Tax=Pedobacter anseongensis TaxID=3133439 RepID=UPI00309AE513
MLKALLVDDELKNLTSMEFLLHNDCEGIEVVYKAISAEQARAWLKLNKADVIFLDITMPGEDGFQFLTSIEDKNIKVVFVTAHNEYALQAIKASAVDYILKPVHIDELQKSVHKIKLSLNNPLATEQHQLLMEHLLDSVYKKNPVKKIAVPQLGSIRFIDLDEIISLQADSNYTIIHLKDMQKLVISKTLREFEDLLDEHHFARIHKSYIVNLTYIKEYSTIDGGVVKMIDGNQWSISRRQLDIFLEKMKTATVMFGKNK